MSPTPPAEIDQLGFRSVEGFQEAWNLGPRLLVDGIPGPLTMSAARLSIRRRQSGLGDLSEHFSAHEFACRCGGGLPGCQRLLVKRELLQSLEGYRSHLGQAVSIVSGYRCVERNMQVGGARNSQHIYGAAADLQPRLSHSTVQAFHLFAGIGYGPISGLVVHVDRRDITTHTGSLATPQVFADGN